MARGRTLQNAVVGAALTIVAFFIPFLSGIAPLFGGGVSGYLQKEGLYGGAKAGIATGFVLTLLVLLIGIFAAILLTTTPVGLPSTIEFNILYLYLGMFAFSVVLIIVGGIGGAIGGAIAHSQSTPG